MDEIMVANFSVFQDVVDEGDYDLVVGDALRMLVVCGPRIDPGHLPQQEGVEIRGYVDDLPGHLYACDAAVYLPAPTGGAERAASVLAGLL